MYQLAWNNFVAWKQHGGDHAIPAAPPDQPVSHAAVLFWEEHCVECSAPQCYSTCTLFQSRRDGRCARFQYGILPNPQVAGLFSFGADVSFRRWAKLETKWPAAPSMRRLGRVRFHERWMNLLEQAGSRIVPILQRWFPSRKFSGACTRVRRQLIRSLSTEKTRDQETTKATSQQRAATFQDSLPVQVNASGSADWPKGNFQANAFYMKCYSPEPQAFRVLIELVTDSPVFRTSLTIQPGWNEHVLDAAEMFDRAGGKAGRILLSIENDQLVRLVFTWLDLVHMTADAALLPQAMGRQTMIARSSIPAHEALVRESTATGSGKPADKVKCVAWDLDNTLWHGVIGDAGADGVTINDEMVQLIQQLDQRGILQTIVSKNNYEIAWPKIESMGLADYFLFPAINWGPKSQNLQQIANELNINIDTFAVVDDSEFERHEISTALPQVRVFDPLHGTDFFARPEFDVPVTEEASGRRLKYLAEAQRRQISQTFRGDYEQFLQSCGMVMDIRHPESADVGRCLELIQRSNQFNLSGRRHSAEQFQILLNSSAHDCFCFDVKDTFGSYGIVGFGAFEKRVDGPVLVEFVLSCRVAQKMVESTFFLWYASQQQQLGYNQLHAELIVTSKNAPLRAVLEQLKFECVRQDGDQQTLTLGFTENMTVPTIIDVRFREPDAAMISETAAA